MQVDVQRSFFVHGIPCSVCGTDLNPQEHMYRMELHRKTLYVHTACIVRLTTEIVRADDRFNEQQSAAQEARNTTT